MAYPANLDVIADVQDFEDDVDAAWANAVKNAATRAQAHVGEADATDNDTVNGRIHNYSQRYSMAKIFDATLSIADWTEINIASAANLAPARYRVWLLIKLGLGAPYGVMNIKFRTKGQTEDVGSESGHFQNVANMGGINTASCEYNKISAATLITGASGIIEYDIGALGAATPCQIWLETYQKLMS